MWAPGNWYPPVEDAELVFSLANSGYTQEQIVRRLMAEKREFTKTRPSDLRVTCRKTVVALLKDPEKWSPYMDQLSMDLAYEGNKKAFDELTYYETKAVMDRLLYTYQHKACHPSWPHLPAWEGIARWCDAVGVDVSTVSKRQERRKTRNAERQAATVPGS